MALALVDCVSGVVWPPVVVEAEDNEHAWAQLFTQAQEAGLNLNALRGVTSDGSYELLKYLRGTLKWVNHQRCLA